MFRFWVEEYGEEEIEKNLEDSAGLAYVKGDHGFVTSQVEEVLKDISEFWELDDKVVDDLGWPKPLEDQSHK